MDKPVAQPKGPSRRLLILLGAVGRAPAGSRVLHPGPPALVPGGAFGRRRAAQLRRGDARRPGARRLRARAGSWPRCIRRCSAPAQGIVTLSVKAGTEVKKGQLLARVESPELMSRLVQERSTLQALQSDLGRQEIAARQAAQRAKQTVDILAMRLAAAERAMTRAQELSSRGSSTGWTSSARRTTWSWRPARAEERDADRAARARDPRRSRCRTAGCRWRASSRWCWRRERQVERLEMAAPFDGMVATVNVQDRDAVAAQPAPADGREPVRVRGRVRHARELRERPAARARRPRSCTRAGPIPAR